MKAPLFAVNFSDLLGCRTLKGRGAMQDGKAFNIGGLTIYGATTEQERIIRDRDAFIDEYCRQKGWDKANLSFDQILEIRKQDGWKNPNTEAA